ncbi:hypothetical protein, unlikely [Trypanosoma brucei gambiense DAL972]|uniref:T. brucei spp.-specific protein n=1 Tax=Trypanosoma brucei gambiense (strain MHOM/CI/86/DAL972) TaxID=679716 RepID=C9ZIK4_TRYB9|nr:hypothetical protein, unlikely [Trypanosoma brucei gambiense DAL972]CBH08996.1 hypothetical protein, unlikely [Trypanosoma brucei gambiense DAL972]|eukprot:XP_011771437.1 hypothetical protein, unlikely [Trypanosoma brucei gambiense DAL972]
MYRCCPLTFLCYHCAASCFLLADLGLHRRKKGYLDAHVGCYYPTQCLTTIDAGIVSLVWRHAAFSERCICFVPFLDHKNTGSKFVSFATVGLTRNKRGTWENIALLLVR